MKDYLMNFNNSFVLFVHFSLFDNTKCKKKVFYDLHSTFREFIHFKMQYYI